MRSSWTTMPRTTRIARCWRKSGGIVESGGVQRPAPGYEMSRSCHSATFSTAALALPRRTRANPVMRSLVIGVRLWGIALAPFWAGADRLFDLAALGALGVADLRREALGAGGRRRDRLQELGVAVAGDDLRRY